MYRIIGADDKEYGPITADQLRQWIAEGRANAQTRVLAEGATEYRPLGEFPEFAASLGTAVPPPPLPPMPSMVEASPNAAAQVNGPALGLICVAIIGFFAQIAALVWQFGFSALAATQSNEPWANLLSGTSSVVFAVIGILMSALILVGGLRMRQLQSYSLAMAASVIAIIPCVSPCCLLGLPIGIWAIVVLSKPEIKSAFR